MMLTDENPANWHDDNYIKAWAERNATHHPDVAYGHKIYVPLISIRVDQPNTAIIHYDRPGHPVERVRIDVKAGFHKKNPDGGYCYMFREELHGDFCGQHTLVHSSSALTEGQTMAATKRQQSCTTKQPPPPAPKKAVTCAIGGVFSVGLKLGACGQHGCGNRCHYTGECEHKVQNA